MNGAAGAERVARVRSMRTEHGLRALTGRETNGPLRVDRRNRRWGNPHKVSATVTREEAIRRYRRDLWANIRSGAVTRAELAQMVGRDLVCWCAC